MSVFVVWGSRGHSSVSDKLHMYLSVKKVIDWRVMSFGLNLLSLQQIWTHLTVRAVGVFTDRAPVEPNRLNISDEG